MNVHVVEDERILAERVADWFLARAETLIRERGTFNVALAGGSTPKAMNGLLAAEPRRGKIDWSKVRFFFGDERCVGPDDPDSNYRMTRETLFTPLGIAESAIFRMRGEDPPEEAARAYAGVLVRELGSPPVFDLVILGMGPDAHTASIFPGTLPNIDETRFVVANTGTKPPPHRITLVPRTINDARAVIIATAGAEKADAVRAAFEGPHDPNRFPIQLVRPNSGRLDWFLDRGAASKVSASVPATPH